MNDQIRAILWAQWRTLCNYYLKAHRAGVMFTAVIGALWYGGWALAGVAIALTLANPDNHTLTLRSLPALLFFVFLYWQVFPILMAGTGAHLDLRRLLVYPIPERRLFALEALLRLSTGIEVMLVLIGIAAGLIARPGVPFWAAIALPPFVLFNLFLAAGVKELLTRWFARKHVREVAIFVLVLAAALPQLLVSIEPRPWMKTVLNLFTGFPFPWKSAGRIAAGAGDLASVASLAGWTLAAWFFGRWRLHRSLSFDIDEAHASTRSVSGEKSWLERFYRLPGRLFNDPLATLIEKELRFLSRAPRFRLVFLMGFTFGQLIWLPLFIQRGRVDESAFTGNYLTFVSIYALMLLGEVLFWNVFGFDRAAVQLYYLTPVRFSTVLAGKNLAAVIFVLLELVAVTVVSFIFRLPLRPSKVLEAFAVTLIFSLYLLALGNLGSTHHPRPLNAAQSWRSASAGRFQAMLLIVYPLLAIPIILAYVARYAFDSDLAFYGGLTFAALLGCVFYWVAMDSAVSSAASRQEQIVAALSQGEGPIGAT
jgi:ABC-2 type transport system permease protein